MATNKINVTAVDFSTSGNIDNGTGTTVLNITSMPSGWSRNGQMIFTPSAVILLGYTNVSGGSYTTIYRCTDLVNYATWTTITLPVAAAWSYGSYGNGKTIIVGIDPANTANSLLIYSTDEGATWGTGLSQTLAFVGYRLISTPVYGNMWLMQGASGSFNYFLTSTNGISWSVAGSAVFGVGSHHNIAYNSFIDRWMYCGTNSIPYLSTTNAATAWTDISTNIGRIDSSHYCEMVISTGKYFITSLRTDYPSSIQYSKISSNGTTWTNILTDTLYIPYKAVAGYYFANIKDLGTGTILVTNRDDTSVLNGSLFTYKVTSTNDYGWASNLGHNNLQLYDTNTNYMLVSSVYTTSVYKKPINIGKLNADRYIDITASKTGATSVTKRLYIKQAQQATPTYILYCNPGSFNLMSTLDGVVDPASFTNATTTLIVTKDGVDQTGWTFSTNNDTGLGASVSGNILSITSLTNSVDLAYANIIAYKAGESSLLLKVAVTKNKSGIVSGINRGASLSSIITNSNTALSIKFLNTGMVQIKYGTGSYGNLIPWFSPVNSVSPPGGSWWMNMTTTGDAFTTSAGSGWLALSTSREFIFDKTGSPTGTYTCNMTVQFGTTSTGGNISVSTGTLQIIIP